MKVKQIYLLMLGIVVLLGACQGPRVYLVRHAEKSTEPANDPHLNIEGLERAADLAAYFSKLKLDAVYATPFNRTRETATPLLEQKKIKLETYQASQGSQIAERALKLKKNTLIIGHSNTLIPLLKNLGLQPAIPEIKDSDYDNLFIVKLNRGQLHLLEKTYGKPTN